MVSFLLPRKAEGDWEVTEIQASGGSAFAVSGEKTQDLVIIRSAERVESLNTVSDFEWIGLGFHTTRRQAPRDCYTERSEFTFQHAELYASLKQTLKDVECYVRH